MGTVNVAFGYPGALRRGFDSIGVIDYQDAVIEQITSNNATSVQSAGAAPTDRRAFDILVRVHADEAVFIAIGANPTANKTTSIRLPANHVEYFAIRPGDKLAVIDEA